MNIVMTGATSFIGSNVLKKILEVQENRIWVVIRPNSKNADKLLIHENIRIVELDMTEIEKLNERIGIPNKLLEIKDEKSRSGPIGFLVGCVDSFRGNKTGIDYEKNDLSK